MIFIFLGGVVLELQDFMNKLANEENNNMRSYILFETLVLKLLEKYLEEQSKELLYSNDSRGLNGSEFDALIPDGIDNSIGPTGVEVKLALRGIRPFFHMIKNKGALFSRFNVKSLLLIVGCKLNSKDRETASKIIDNVELKIWDVEDLSRLWHKYSDLVGELVPKLSEVIMSNVVSNSLKTTPHEWKDTRVKLLKQLKLCYKRDDLVLFLGAGVSKEAGVPDWNTLVSDLLVNMISEKLSNNKIPINNQEQQEIVKEIKSVNDSSPLLQARYIRTGLEKSFTRVLTEVLYKNFDKTNYGTSDLLKAISKMCVPPRNGIGIRSVVTYNFDDLIEKNLENSGVSLRTIYREIDISSKDELGVYHVHGYLPRENGDDGTLGNLLVFSEEGYHSLFLDPYSWSNIAQLNFLRENTCLMIGLSLTDPNLRRLLDIAARKNDTPKHYVILKKHSFNGIKSNEEIRKEVIMKFASVDQKLQEQSYLELGLNVIWVENYNEIPGILESIRN